MLPTAHVLAPLVLGVADRPGRAFGAVQRSIAGAGR